MKNRRLIALLLCICTLLTLIAGAFTVRAEESDASNTLFLDKGVTEIVKDKQYELTLEAYATGEEVPAPVDVVFVVDQSTSMFSTLNTDLNEFKGRSYSEFKSFLNQGSNKSLVEQEGYFVVRINDEAKYFNSNGKYSTFYSTVDAYDSAYSSENSFAEKFHVIGKSVTKLNGSLTNYRKNNADHPSHEDGIEDYVWLAVRWNPDEGRLEYNATVLESTRATVQDGGIGGAEYYSADKYWLPFPECADDISASNMRFYQTLYGATYDAMMIFYEKTKSIENCKVAIVGFSEGGGVFGATKTNQYVEDLNLGNVNLTQAEVDDLTSTMKKINSNYGSSAFVNVGSANLLKRIKNINPNYYGTVTDAGLALANYLFKNSDITGARPDAKRFVILYTDGNPVGTMLHEYDATTAQARTQGILQAYKLKNTYDSTIFAITPPSKVDNIYLSCISSEYPQAQSTSNTGTKNSDGVEYAIAANSSEELGAAFNMLANTIAQTQVNLGKTAVLKDIISPSFKLPDGCSEEDIKVYTAPYNGTSFGELQEFSNAVVEIDNKTINVTNFDYSQNFISSVPRNGYYGCKLVVKVPIVPNPDFLGGDQVVTNEPESGIYSNGDVVDRFPVPDVNITVKEITPDYKNDAIYVSQQAYLPDIANIGHFKVGTTEYLLDGINNAYVEVKYTIQDKDDPENNYMTTTIPQGLVWYDELLDGLHWDKTGNIDLIKVLENDKQYEIICDVVSVNNKDGNKSQTTGDATISVYKPHVTFKDSLLKYNAPSNYDGNNYVSVVWKNGENVAGAEGNSHNVLLGNAPNLTYSYDPVDSPVQVERKVKVTGVTPTHNNGNHYGATDVTNILEHTTFYRDDCAVCGHKHGKVEGDACNFIVHLETFDLVINKVVNGKIDDGQSFLFNVDGPGFSGDIVISKFTYDSEHNQTTGSVTIKGLTAGEYTIEELIDWSWRYKIVGDLEQTVTSSNGNASVTFTNEREDPYWLSGETSFRNLFNGNVPNPAPNPTPTAPADPQG